MAASKVTMKLTIDTNSRRVMFAEAGKECVNFLFHILALPIGSVIRLLTTKGMVGSLGNLYESPENLDTKYIQSHQNKDILLKPKSLAWNDSSIPLFLLTNSPAIERQFYRCPYHNDYVTDDPRTTCPSTSEPINTNLTYHHIQGSAVKIIDHVSTDGPRTPCPSSSKVRARKGKKKRETLRKNDCKYVSGSNPSCSGTMNMNVGYVAPPAVNVTYTSICGRSMNTKLDYVAPSGENELGLHGGMVKGVVTYMVSDDLVVKPMSVISSITLLKEFSIKDVSCLEEKVVTLGMDEALKLLKSSLQSKSVLTSAFMDNIKE